MLSAGLTPPVLQLLSCKSLGMLRRIQIKHKATMEPEHVADTLLCLQHLVRAARHARQTGARMPGLPFMHHATSQARSQPRVRAAGELSRSKGRASESDGHMEQLMAQMLGELGSSIWFMVSTAHGGCMVLARALCVRDPYQCMCCSCLCAYSNTEGPRVAQGAHADCLQPPAAVVSECGGASLGNSLGGLCACCCRWVI